MNDPLEMRNAGLHPGVSRNQLGGWLLSFSTVSDLQAQMLARRFRLSSWNARDLARLYLGECGHV